jgi:cell volume regulation protein A
MFLNVLTIMGFTVIIAVIGHTFFDKTGVPESVFMIMFGLILGPLSGIISINEFSGIIPYVFTLSIVIILLENGLTTDFQMVLETMKSSTIFTIIVLLVTSLLCGTFLRFILGWSFVSSLILGVICSGTSTLPIMYFTSRMRLNPDVTQMLIFESIINDVTIITMVSLIIQGLSPSTGSSVPILSLIKVLVARAVGLGILFSLAWTVVLVKVKEDLSLKYLTTLAISILLYYLCESWGGSGVIAVMVFGITIGNLPAFFRSHLLVRQRVLWFFTKIEIMQDEVTFLVKNTFFFLLGLMFNVEAVTINILLVALVLTILMIISRWVSYKIIGFVDRRYVNNIWFVSLMVSRGFTAGLTAFMSVEKGLQMPVITDVVIVLILFTNLAATLGFIWITRKFDNIDEKV